MIAKGSIDGFGSVYVNGIRYNTDNAEIIINDNLASNSDLGLGMIVTVFGELNDSQNGRADRVIYDSELQGPVADLIRGADTLSFTLFDTTIIASNTSVFANTQFDTLANGDLVEVSGLPDSTGQLIASRIEGKGTFNQNLSEIEINGTISNLSASSFNLGSFTVNYTPDVLEDSLNATLSNGLLVEVKGTLSANTITAVEIDREDDLFLGENLEDADISLEGIVSNYNGNNDFTLYGLQVNASNAIFTPSTLAQTIDNGSEVEVKGRINNNVLMATEVKTEDGEIKIKSLVSDVDASTGQITLSYPSVGSITIQTDANTQFDNEDGTPQIEGININDFLELKAFTNTEGSVIALEIDRKDEADDMVLQGIVEDYNAITGTITILGLTFATNSNTEYKNNLEQSLSAAEFYLQLNNGDRIKVKDENEPFDGVADEVSFE